MEVGEVGNDIRRIQLMNLWSVLPTVNIEHEWTDETSLRNIGNNWKLF